MNWQKPVCITLLLAVLTLRAVAFKGTIKPMNWQKSVCITLLLAVLTLRAVAFKGTIKPMNWQKPVCITLLLAVLTLCVAAFKGTIKPMNWQKPVYMLDPDDDENNGYQNEDFIVWMRTAALPNFRKLYRRVNHTEEFREGMPKGNYSLIIDYSKQPSFGSPNVLEFELSIHTC